MKIIIDIDDCVCNTKDCDFNFGYIYNKKRNPLDNNLYEPNHFVMAQIFNFNKDEETKFYLNQKKYVMKKTAMFPNFFAKEVINTLKKEGHEIIFLTSRNSFFWNNNAKKYAKKWLRKFKFKYDKLVTDCEDKEKYCIENNADLLIDDNPAFLEKANQSNISTITFYQDYNKKHSQKLNRTASCWAEIYTMITNKVFRP